MRLAGYGFALASVAGLAAFSLNGADERSQLPIALALQAEAVKPLPPTGTLESPMNSPAPSPAPSDAESRSQPVAVDEAAADRGTSRRPSSRRWSRWTEPIPSPAEWEPPGGEVRIALQAGHWRAHEAPPELNGLKDNGTSWRGKPEWESNLDIAQRAAALLEELGYVVDILPAVVPPGYRAHLFISIHADGSPDPAASGYRVAGPRRDATGRASQVVRLLEQSYGEATGLSLLPNVTRRMRNYYAWNYRRYEHALHPMTIGVILETGFLTSARDRRVIVDAPDRAARGIVAAVTAFPDTPPPAAPPVSGLQHD